MLQVRRLFCTALKRQQIQEEVSKKPLKFISRLPLSYAERQINDLERSLRMRKSSFDIRGLAEEIQMLRSLEAQMLVLEERRKTLTQQYGSTPETSELKEKLKYEGQMNREDIRRLRQVMTPLKESLTLKTTVLPNILNPVTQQDAVELLRVQGKVPPVENRTGRFSEGPEAWIDLMLPLLVSKFFQTKGYVKTSNPDFLKRFVARSGGVEDFDGTLLDDHDISDSELQQSLVGGGSVSSFLPYITRLSFFPKQFPLRMVSVGQQYTKLKQENCVQFFVAVRTLEDAAETIKEVTELYKQIYQAIGQSFRLTQVGASSLSTAESMRIDLEMQDSGGGFTSVASIQQFDQYVSHRVLFSYREGKKYGFPYIVGGTIVNTTRLMKLLNVEEFSLESVGQIK